MLINRPLFFHKRGRYRFLPSIHLDESQSVWRKKEDSPEVNTVCEHGAGKGRRTRRNGEDVQGLESFGWILVSDAFG